MNLSKELPTGVVVAIKQQQEILMKVVEVALFDLEEEDGEDVEPSFCVPRRAWTFKRFGSFWEKDVPENNAEFFKESFRMNTDTFSLLEQQLEVLRKEDTKFRMAIPLEKRIAIALYTLGSSSEYRAVGRLFGVSTSSVSNILHEFCRAMIGRLSHEYLPPNFVTETKVDECVKGFEEIGFPQCLGAIDGCHIEIKPSAAEVFDHFNYKGWYSTVLFALVDYRFLYANVGCPGRCNDSQIYRHSQLSKIIESSSVLKQKSKKICGTNVPVLLLGDSAFKFSPTVMKPYPFSTSASPEQQTFNYNLSKSRRVVENAFGHLKARFRRIGKGMDNHPKFNSKIIMACCVLHNFLNCHNSLINESWKLDQNESRQQPDENNMSSDYSVQAEDVRRAIATFLTEK